MRDTSPQEKAKLRALLRKLRKECGLRQIDLARRLDRPQSYVSKYESGEKTLDIFEIKRICEALGPGLNKRVCRFGLM